ncbi:MAG: 7-cyano-7-deazaguanine synthase QueC [Candidatus Omnitrophota bacterium]|nr:7-cyano-7-deazaguanine synthase QueC [Candidatus Omnitrophota bacterium]
MRSKKAVVLLSGGLDSATALYLAKSRGFDCRCLIFDYGQRHRREISSGRAIARKAGCAYQVLKIKLPWKGSALLDKRARLPITECREPRTENRKPSSIPSTYVPARNIIFLSFALSYAEACGAGAIFIGAHAQDYSGYPDCRPEFYRAFNKVVVTGTKAGVEGKGIAIETPLIALTKAEIIRLGSSLGVPFELTWSCYRGGRKPCGVCDSCFYRARGFLQAGVSCEKERQKK